MDNGQYGIKFSNEFQKKLNEFGGHIKEGYSGQSIHLKDSDLYIGIKDQDNV